MELHEVHFEKLVECVKTIQATPNLPENVWIGRSSQSWLRSIMRDEYATMIDLHPSSFNDVAYDRQALLAKISERKHKLCEENLRDLVVDILAWGEMSVKNARHALPAWEQWKRPCMDLIRGLSATDAYDQFYRLQHDRAMKGIGPAYYTKLIYFLGNGDGLIMDQWTGRSMNLLFAPFIKINKDWKSADRGYVDKRNDMHVYGRYIEGVRLLSANLSEATGTVISPSRTEEFIFSISSKKKKKFLGRAEHAVLSAWRKYVTESEPKFIAPDMPPPCEIPQRNAESLRQL